MIGTPPYWISLSTTCRYSDMENYCSFFRTQQILNTYIPHTVLINIKTIFKTNTKKQTKIGKQTKHWIKYANNKQNGQNLIRIFLWNCSILYSSIMIQWCGQYGLFRQWPHFIRVIGLAMRQQKFFQCQHRLLEEQTDWKGYCNGPHYNCQWVWLLNISEKFYKENEQC